MRVSKVLNDKKIMPKLAVIFLSDLLSDMSQKYDRLLSDPRPRLVEKLLSSFEQLKRRNHKAPCFAKLVGGLMLVDISYYIVLYVLS